MPMALPTTKKIYKITADVLYSCTYYIDTQSENQAVEAVESGEEAPEATTMATSPMITSIEKVEK